MIAPPVRATTRSAVRAATRSAVRAATRSAVRAATRSAVRAATRSAVRAATRSAVRDATRSSPATTRSSPAYDVRNSTAPLANVCETAPPRNVRTALRQNEVAGSKADADTHHLKNRSLLRDESATAGDTSSAPSVNHLLRFSSVGSAPYAQMPRNLL
jgi:hypothetical protein